MKDKKLNEALAYVDSWLPYKFERSEIPGMSVSIAHKGKVIFSKAYGYSNVEAKKKMTSEHIFRVASHSKTFTVVAIMQLQEKAKLRLDDPIVGYIPWLKNHKDKRWEKVTIRQLLSHSAGVIRDGMDADYWELGRDFPSEVEFRKEILQTKLVFDNNTKQKYPNYGYSLLGQVVARASGKTYNEYVTKNIITSLGLRYTTPELDMSGLDNYVTGYSRKNPTKRLQIAHINTHSMSAATGFCSTAEDLCKYFSAHIIGSNKLLNDESKKEMQRTQGLCKESDDTYSEYGLGLWINYQGGKRLYGHGGGFPGFITKTFCDPENKLVVSVMVNSLSAPSMEAAKGILSVIYKFIDEPSKKPKHDISKFEGRFVALWCSCDIVAVGNKIFATNPNSWQPFSGAEELEYVNKNTLKIKQAEMASSPGEAVIYKGSGAIRYAGITMLSEDKYYKTLKTKKKICTPVFIQESTVGKS